METLVVFAQYRDDYHGRSDGSNPGSFGSPSRDFREINCRSFQSGVGILPTPVKARSSFVSGQSSLKPISYDQNPKYPNRIAESSSVPIPVSINHVGNSVKEDIRGSLDEFFYSELWAGPAYSNSPPPSSLPIPKFSIKAKRTVSLDLPSLSASDDDLLTLTAKSAPTSPTSECSKRSQIGLFVSGEDSATNTLRRILNLDMVGTD